MKLVDKERALTAIVHEIRASHNEDTILVGESPEEIGLIKAFDIIRHLPAVEKRPEGRWIKHSTGLIFKSEWGKCSECGNILDFNGVNAGRGDANYCPNCGADMRRKQGENI